MLNDFSRKIAQNKHYQNDILYITQPTRNILLTLGAWPSLKNTKSIYMNVHNLLLICINCILFSCEFIPAILYWLIEATTRVRLQTIPFLLYDFMSVCQYSIFIFRYSELRQCLKYVDEDWQNVLSVNARNIMLKFAKTGKRLIMICGIFMYSDAFTYRTILPLSQKRIVNEQNITIRLFACPVYLFSIDVQVSPVYEIIFLTQWLTGFVSVAIVTSACGLTAIFVVHICGQLEIFIVLMNSLVQKPFQEEHEVNKKLAEIVEHHIRVRRYDMPYINSNLLYNNYYKFLILSLAYFSVFWYVSFFLYI